MKTSESTRTAKFAVLMEHHLTEKRAAPGCMYGMIGFMNMHKALFLETVATAVIGEEQAGRKAHHSDVLLPP